MRNKAFRIYLCGLLVLMVIVCFCTAVVIRFGFVERTLTVYNGLVAEGDTLFEQTGPIRVVEITQVNQRIERTYSMESYPWLELVGDTIRNNVAIWCDEDLSEHIRLDMASDTLRICVDFEDLESEKLEIDAGIPVQIIMPAGRCLTVSTPAAVPVLDAVQLSQFQLDSLKLTLDADVIIEECCVADIDAATDIHVLASEIGRLCLKAVDKYNYYNVVMERYRWVAADSVSGNIGTLALTSPGPSEDRSVTLAYSGQLPQQIVSEPGLDNIVYLHTTDSYMVSPDSMAVSEIKNDSNEIDH